MSSKRAAFTQVRLFAIITTILLSSAIIIAMRNVHLPILPAAFQVFATLPIGPYGTENAEILAVGL